MKQKKNTPENPLLNIFFNILIPILILNKLSKVIGPQWGLVLALAFPLGYGIYDLLKRKKINPLSILGLANILITGGLALLGIHGFWFAVKEAAFPTLVGLFVLASAFTKNPFIKTLLLNPQMMNTELMMEKINFFNQKYNFDQTLKKSTLWLSLSFFFSAVLNYILARQIFTEMPLSLPLEEQNQLLNTQLAEMTKYSFIVILLPSFIFLGLIVYFLFKKIEALTGLKVDELMHAEAAKKINSTPNQA